MEQHTDAASVADYCTAAAVGDDIADVDPLVDCLKDCQQTEEQSLTAVLLVEALLEWNPLEVVAGRQTEVVMAGQKDLDGLVATCRRSHADCQLRKAPWMVGVAADAVAVFGVKRRNKR